MHVMLDGQAVFDEQELTITIGSLGRASLERIRELAAGKPKASRFLDGLVAEASQLQPFTAKLLKGRYALDSEIRGLRPEEAKPGPDDAAVARLIPVKTTPVPLGEFFPFTELFGAFAGDQNLQMLAFERFGAQALIEMLLLIDGKRSLADIRDLLSFEFQAVESGEVLKIATAFEKAKLIKMGGQT